jgi:hypothetical protein
MRLALAVSLGLALAACGPRARTSASRAAPADDRAFVFGVLQVPEKLGAPGCVALIEAAHERPAGAAHGCVAMAPDGVFWIADVRPTRWVVDGVVAGGKLHRFGEAARPFAVQPGALHDWGVFRVVTDAAPGRLALEPSDRPTHEEVLRKVLEKEGLEPRWRARLEERLRAARGTGT